MKLLLRRLPRSWLLEKAQICHFEAVLRTQAGKQHRCYNEKVGIEVGVRLCRHSTVRVGAPPALSVGEGGRTAAWAAIRADRDGGR